jgi:hypothetical protein
MRIDRKSMIVSVGLLLGACGGSGGSTPRSLSSGLDSGKVASSLSAAEQNTLCTRANEYFMSLLSKEDTCKMAGLLGAALSGGDSSLSEAKSACSGMYNLCMQGAEEKVDNTKTLNDCTKGLSDCSATVGEIETCLNDSGAATKAAMAELPSCSQITEATLNSTFTPASTEPASCKSLQTKCPNLSTNQSSISDS